MSKRDRSHQGENRMKASLRDIDAGQAPTGRRGANDGTMTAAEIFAQKQGKALEVLSTRDLRTGAFVWTSVGLKIEGDVYEDDWKTLGKILKEIGSSIQWLIGDFIAYGESLEFGDQKAIAAEFGFEYGTVREYARVARGVDLSIRVDKLTFKHHQIIASLERKEQKYWLQQALENGWTTQQLYDAVHDKPKQLNFLIEFSMCLNEMLIVQAENRN